MIYENLKVREQDYIQNVVLLMENGEQKSLTIKSMVARMDNPEPDARLFQRTIKRDGKYFRLIRYSENQDVLFYKLVTK